MDTKQNVFFLNGNWEYIEHLFKSPFGRYFEIASI